MRMGDEGQNSQDRKTQRRPWLISQPGNVAPILIEIIQAARQRPINDRERYRGWENRKIRMDEDIIGIQTGSTVRATIIELAEKNKRTCPGRCRTLVKRGRRDRNEHLDSAGL